MERGIKLLIRFQGNGGQLEKILKHLGLWDVKSRPLVSPASQNNWFGNLKERFRRN